MDNNNNNKKLFNNEDTSDLVFCKILINAYNSNNHETIQYCYKQKRFIENDYFIKNILPARDKYEERHPEMLTKKK